MRKNKQQIIEFFKQVLSEHYPFKKWESEDFIRDSFNLLVILKNEFWFVKLYDLECDFNESFPNNCYRIIEIKIDGETYFLKWEVEYNSGDGENYYYQEFELVKQSKKMVEVIYYEKE